MEETIEVKDILHQDWFDENGNGDIYVSAYHCLTDVLQRLQKSHLVGQIFKTTFLIIDTVLEYQTIDFVFKNLINKMPQFESSVQNRKTEQCVILFLFSKYKKENENEILSELQSARGLLSNVEGKNTNYWHITDYILHLPKANVSIVSPVIKVPDPVSAFNTEIIAESVSRKIDSLEPYLISRIKLCLRWIDSAEHEINSLDEFLKLWFAIETLAMPDTTDIKPLVNRLQLIYNIDKYKAQKYFAIGKIFGLRSNVVHNGLNIGIHQQLNSYLRALLNDILMDICGYPSKRLAEKILEDTKFNKADWLP